MTTNEIAAFAISILTGISIIGGILGRYLSKLLAERKDNVIQDFEIRYLKEKIEDMEEDIKELRRNQSK